MSSVEVIVEDLKTHPSCPHGPTILFSRRFDRAKRNFYSCSACRDRKLCTFFLYEDEKDTTGKKNQQRWEKESKKFLKNINHRKLFLTLNQVIQLPEHQRIFCHTCSRFETAKYLSKHEDHQLTRNITEDQLKRPSELLPPLEDAKKEAQFLFSKSATAAMVKILQNLNYKNIICMGTPRIHEFISNECPQMTSLLLDIDDRFHNFYGPLQFCWHNTFNNHFFFEEAKEVFDDFLTSNSGKDLAVIMDPPFGGRVEPLAQTLNAINSQYQTLNSVESDLPIFWIFPYFMEPQIVNSLPKFSMLDYKVDYDNHPLFKDKGRKNGSPVRIFTNVDACKIVLPEEEGYKYCKTCQRWVAAENIHCKLCNACTSKDGRTYKHCKKCERCVKPTWEHCKKCGRCAQQQHNCGEIAFVQNCFHCKEPGHKKRDCPKVDRAELHKKRKLQSKDKEKKKLKTK